MGEKRVVGYTSTKQKCAIQRLGGIVCIGAVAYDIHYRRTIGQIEPLRVLARIMEEI